MTAGLVGWVVAALAVTAWLRAGLRARVRAELIARACHEVRGPLAAASLALHAAAAGRGAGGVQAAEREILRAGTAVDDVCAAGRGRRVRDRPERVDVRELIALQASTWGPVARTLGTDLRVRGRGLDATVRADRVRLARATANLVVNALEHGHGPVTLGASARDGRVRIEVVDGGPERDGASAVAGTRAERPAGWRPGGPRGRGLDIVADFAERHGGRLVARSAAGATRVAVELPRAEEPA